MLDVDRSTLPSDAEEPASHSAVPATVWSVPGDATTTPSLRLRLLHSLPMGRRLDVDSTVGDGTTFTITLPITQARHDAEAAT